MSFTLKLLQAPAFRLRTNALHRSLSEAVPYPELQADIEMTMAAAQDVARRLAPYSSQITLDRSAARAGMVELEAWLNDHGSNLQKLGMDAVLPESERAVLDPGKARAFVSWLWIEASDGLPLYSGGNMTRAVAEGYMSETEARADLAARRPCGLTC